MSSAGFNSSGRSLMALLAVGLVGNCSKKGRDYGTLGCLDGWPAAATNTLASPLSVTPSIVWQRNLGLNAAPFPARIAVSNNRVVVSAGADWAALDRMSGGVLFTK